MTEETISIESGVALSGFNSSPKMVHGIAIGEDEVTEHLDGDKFWPAEALRDAVDSLVGVQLTKNHEHDRVEGVIGEVTKARYKDGVGILFEAKVYDEQTAHKIDKGLLEVSIHASHGMAGTRDDGAMIVEAVQFKDLSVVPRGAAGSNEVNPGKMQVAALSEELDTEFDTEYESELDKDDKDNDKVKYGYSEEEVADILGDIQPITDEKVEDARERIRDRLEADEEISSEMRERVMGRIGGILSAEMDEAYQMIEQVLINSEGGSHDEDEESEDSDDSPSDGQSGESASVEDTEADSDTTDDTTMTEEEEENFEEQIAELEDEVADLEETVADLEDENDTLLEEVMEVRQEYASALAENSAFDAAELADKFTVSELAEKYEDADVELAAGSPAPRGEDVEEAELDETSEDGVSDEEVAMLKEKKERFESLNMDGAAQSVARRIEDATGE